MALKVPEKLKRRSLWAAVAAAAAGVLAGSMGIADGVRVVIEALLK